MRADIALIYYAGHGIFFFSLDTSPSEVTDGAGAGVDDRAASCHAVAP